MLAFISRAGALSFHLAFWPGLTLGIMRVLESALAVDLFPAWLSIGSGKYALDLGVNVYGLMLCVGGYLLGAALSQRRRRAEKLTGL